MLEKLQAAIKVRIVIVFMLVHIGLALGIYTFARLTVTQGWDQTTISLLATLICLYGGFAVAVAFIVLPVLPWIRRFQKAEHWTERLIKELPTLLEHLPRIIAAFQSIMATWRELKQRSASPSPNSAPQAETPAASPPAQSSFIKPTVQSE